MASGPDPDQIPDDATGRDLVGHVAEDIARYLAVRLAALLACVAIVAGLLAESASAALKGTSLAAGCLGVLMLLCAGLFRWRRSRQWWTIGIVIAVCGGLLATVLISTRS